MEPFETLQLPSYVKTVLEKLEQAGHRGYLVGGSLRDLLRGITPHDYDMTTDATPDEMQQIFCDFRTVTAGLKHGTLTVICEGQPIELTTHRVDGTYVDSRHPESVSFTRRLQEDLSRRDFTVNAMAWSPYTGLVDLFDGQGDLQRGALRAVGDAATRFGEDALRILRALRFASQLNFRIVPETLLGAAQKASGLAKISVERIFAEYVRMLEGENADYALRILQETACTPYVFFEFAPALEKEVQLNLLPREAALRTAALLPTLTPAQATALARRWHAPNSFGEAFAAYLAAAGEALPVNEFEARRFVVHYWGYFEGALLLRGARGEEIATALSLCRRVAKDGSAVELRRLAVNGKELQLQLGVLPRRTAALLQRLQELVWQEPACNKKAALLRAASEICEKERDFCE